MRDFNGLDAAIHDHFLDFPLGFHKPVLLQISELIAPAKHNIPETWKNVAAARKPKIGPSRDMGSEYYAKRRSPDVSQPFKARARSCSSGRNRSLSSFQRRYGE